MLNVFFSAKFKKDYKKMQKQGRTMELLLDVVDTLAAEQTLPSQYLDHPLSGNYKGHRECHILPDWLLVYKIDRRELLLTLTRTGTHSELFSR